MKLISVIIPVYNHLDTLSYALASLLEQTHEQVEIIIVDDGSHTPVPQHVVDFDKRVSIRLIRQENKGAPAARNRGLQEAQGEYVIFWDADVIAHREMLSRMLSALEAQQDASFAYSNTQFGWKKIKTKPFDPDALKQDNYIHSASLIRREHVLPWDESLKRFQDWDLWLRLSKEGKRGVWIDEYLYKIFPHKQGISTWLPSFAYKKPWRLLPWVRKKVKEYDEAKRIIFEKHKDYFSTYM